MWFDPGVGMPDNASAVVVALTTVGPCMCEEHFRKADVLLRAGIVRQRALRAADLAALTASGSGREALQPRARSTDAKWMDGYS